MPAKREIIDFAEIPNPANPTDPKNRIYVRYRDLDGLIKSLFVPKPDWLSQDHIKLIEAVIAKKGK